MKVYVAGSISGKSYDEVMQYFNGTKAVLEGWGYQVLSPMMGKGHLRTEKTFRAKDYRHPISTNRAIVGRDRWMVGQADIIYMDLSMATHVSIGSMFELAWAYELGKHTVLVIPEDNVHQHAFCLACPHIVFQTSGEALMYLKDAGEDLNFTENKGEK